MLWSYQMIHCMYLSWYILASFMQINRVGRIAQQISPCCLYRIHNRNQYWAGRVYDLCDYYMTGTPEGSTESGFMETPGIEPATPGLQGITIIHYTTGASQSTKAWRGPFGKVRHNLRKVIIHVRSITRSTMYQKASFC